MGAAQKRAEEEKIKKEEQDKKEAEAQAKKKQMEEDERKRQEMLAAQKEGGKKSSGPAMDARKEMSKSKEQVEEEMKISLSIRIKPLALEEMDSDELKNKANQIWGTIVSLETDKYDYEQRQLDQDYEFKELAERQKLELRSCAPSGWNRCGRRSSQSFQSVPPRSCQSGSESGQAKRLEIRRRPRVRRRLPLRRPQRRSTRKRRKTTRRRRRRKRSKLKAGPNFHHNLFLGLKSNSYPCNKRHSIRVIASIPRGLSPDVDGGQLPGELHNLQLVIAICLETRQVPVRICYALKIRSPHQKKKKKKKKTPPQKKKKKKKKS